jgi:hypothetical protein
MASFGPWPAAGDEKPPIADKRRSRRLPVLGVAALRVAVAPTTSPSGASRLRFVERRSFLKNTGEIPSCMAGPETQIYHLWVDTMQARPDRASRP